jgi:hypothetical protein
MFTIVTINGQLEGIYQCSLTDMLMVYDPFITSRDVLVMHEVCVA